MPSSSAACQTCKIRRIKCDETRPICQRCTKARRICLGTRATKQACFSIHIENPYATGSSKRPRGPRSSLTLLRPHLDLETRALAYYLQYHLLAPDTSVGLNGLAECVSEWQISGRSCPMVELALSSMALAVFSRCQQHPSAAAEGSSRYSRLLNIAHKGISQVGTPVLEQRDIDSYLLAIFLMGRYEGAVFCPVEEPTPAEFRSMRSWSHHDGATAVLKIWYDNLRHLGASTVVKQTRRGLIRSALMRDLPLPLWMCDGAEFGEHGLDVCLDRTLVRITNLHHSLENLQLHESLDPEHIAQLERKVECLDDALEDWAASLPPTWAYRCHRFRESNSYPRKHFYSPVVYSFSKPAHAMVWNHYFATRMLVKSMHARSLGISLPHPSFDEAHEHQLRQCVAQLHYMADSLASTIPYALQRFTVSESSPNPLTLNPESEVKPYLANLAVWPLTIASSLYGIDSVQQQWFRSELAALGRLLGGGVLEYAESGQWPVL